jgi:hypothetical protein
MLEISLHRQSGGGIFVPPITQPKQLPWQPASWEFFCVHFPDETMTSANVDTLKEAQSIEAEDLRFEAHHDRVKDPDREAKIAKLESAGDVVEQIAPAGNTYPFAASSYSTADRVKIISAKMTPAWHKKSQAAQRRILEKITGSYRPARTDPITTGKGARSDLIQGSLAAGFHPVAGVRARTIKADALIAAGDAKRPKSVVRPAPVAEPVMGYCRNCHKGLPRVGIRADTQFCQNNGGRCSREFRERERSRAVAEAAFQAEQRSNVVQPATQTEWVYRSPVEMPLPPMSGSYAARSGRIQEYLAQKVVRTG